MEPWLQLCVQTIGTCQEATINTLAIIGLTAANPNTYHSFIASNPLMGYVLR
jgi:hypothetical protein